MSFFSFLGKAFVVLGLAGILIGAGYYVGAKFNKQPITSAVPSAVKAPISHIAATPILSSPTGAPTTTTGRFAVQAGGIKPFSAYMLSGVGGWTQTKTETSTQSKVVLTKGRYTVTILQGAFGGSPCIFPGDQPQDMAVQLSSSTMIELLTGNPLRRGQAQPANANEADFTVCQKTTSGYSTITDFGAINYITPLSPDIQVLAEMDAMIGSLQKQ